MSSALRAFSLPRAIACASRMTSALHSCRWRPVKSFQRDDPQERLARLRGTRIDAQDGRTAGAFTAEHEVAVRQERRGLRLGHLHRGEEMHAAELAVPVDDEQGTIASGQEPQIAGLRMHGYLGEEQAHQRLLLAALAD